MTSSSSRGPGRPDVDGFRWIGEEEIHRTHLVTLAKRQLEDPEGTSFERYVVRHPGAVAVVPLGEDGQVTLVRQLRPAVWTNLLEIPAGTRDVDGEPPEETARRELAEEAGLNAERVELLARVYNSPGFTDQETLIFLATGLEHCDTGRHGIEERFMQTETVRLDDLSVLISSGRLTDETTLLGLCLAREALSERT